MVMDRRVAIERRPAEAGVRAVRAFTMLEIIIAVVLMMLLAAITWPTLARQITASELPESVDRLRSALFMLRSEAAMEHRRFRMRFEIGEQQPLIEWEPDPIRRRGEWERYPAGWANEPFLLGDVQVYEIQIGRPIWMIPVRDTVDQPDADRLTQGPAGIEETDDREAREADEMFLRGGLTEDEEIDPLRPTIVYETDGKTDWALLILARSLPEEELEEDALQKWIVLDGRTGRTIAQDKVSDEQLADPEFFVQREKLGLPDLVNTGDLSLTAGALDGGGSSDGASDERGGFGGRSGSGGGDASGLDGLDSGGLASGELDSRGLDAESQKEPSRAPRRGGSNEASGQSGGRTGQQSGTGGGTENGDGGSDSIRDGGRGSGGGDSSGGDSDLEAALADSDLSEEEKENIRRAFQNSGNP